MVATVRPNDNAYRGTKDGRPPKPGPNWVWNAAQGRWVKKGSGGGSSPPPNPNRGGGGKKVQSIEEWADAQAQKIVDEQLKAIKDRQDTYNSTLREEAMRRAQDAQRFAQMVQGLGIDKQIAGIYGSAGRDIAGMAQGFAGDIRNIAAADAAAQTNMLSGTGQEGAVRNEGVGMGDVVYGVGGYIPGKTMGEQGAAFAADAARQPAFMLADRIGQSEQAYNDALKSSNEQFLDAILEAKMGKTELSESFASKKTDLIFAQQKMRLDQLNEDREYWLKMQAYYLSVGKLKLAKQAEARARATETRYANETAGRDADGNVSPDYYTDNQGRVVPKGYKYNKGGILVKIGGSSSSGGKDGLTPNARAELVTKINNSEEDVTERVLKIVKTWGMGPFPNEKKKRQALASQMFKLYKHLAQGNPQATKALRAMIARAMKTVFSGEAEGSGDEGLFD